MKTFANGTYIVDGKITAFNARSWWGEAVYDLTVVKFHGTSVRGMTTRYLPRAGSSLTTTTS